MLSRFYTGRYYFEFFFLAKEVAEALLAVLLEMIETI